MVSKAQLSRWRRDPVAFVTEAVRVRGEDGRLRPVELWPIQLEALEQLGKPDRLGRFKSRVIWWCWPRRTGKSSLARYLALWSFVLWPHREVWFVSNSREQVYNVLFSDLRHDILASPALLDLVGSESNVRAREIIAEPLGSRCSLLPYDNSKAVGIKVDAGVLSECWAMGGTEVFDALLVGTSTTNGLIILDSTAPVAGSAWEKLLKDPPSGFKVDWRGIEAYELTPISPDVIESLERTMSPPEFKAKIRNEIFEEAVGLVFTPEQIASAQRFYPVPPSKPELEQIFKRECGNPDFSVRIGLDRGLGRGSLSVVSSIAYSTRGARRLALLCDQVVVDGASQESVLNAILAQLQLYEGRVKSVHVEVYQSADLAGLLRARGAPVVLETASSKAQAEAWPILYSSLLNGEFVFSSEFTEFAEELAHLGHDPVKNRWGSITKRRVGGPGDDRLYSALWPLAAALKRHGFGGGHVEVGYSNLYRRSAEELLGHGLEGAEVAGTILDW